MFADEVGVRDWMLKHLGKVTHASYKHREMFGATESGAIFKLLSRTGRLNWRQVLPDGEKTDMLLLNKQTLFTVSAATGHAYMWQATDGALLWDRHLPVHEKSKACDGKYAPVDMDDDGLDDVVVLANNAVTLLSSGGSGKPFWTYTPTSTTERLVLLHVADEGDDSVVVVGVDEKENKVTLHRLSPSTGVEASSSDIVGAPIARGGEHSTGMVLTESGARTYVAWLASYDNRVPLPSLVVVDVANGKKSITARENILPTSMLSKKSGNGATTTSMTLTPVTTDPSRPGVAPFLSYEVGASDTAFPDVEGQHGVLRVSTTTTMEGEKGNIHIDTIQTYTTPATRTFAYGVSGGGTSTTGSAGDKAIELAFPVVLERTSSKTSMSVVANVVPGVQNGCDVANLGSGIGYEEHGVVAGAFVDAYTTKDGKSKCRCLIVSEDWSIRMVSSSPKIIKKSQKSKASTTLWERRTEALADSMSIEMVDFAAVPIIQSTEYTYVDRLVGQSKYLTSIPSSLLNVVTMVQSFLEDKLNKNSERRRQKMTEEQATIFGFNKLVVSSSSSGKIVALRAEDGSVVWERFVPGVESTHVLRPTMKIGSNPTMVVIAKSRKDGSTRLLELDASNGKTVGGRKGFFPANVAHTLTVPLGSGERFLLTIDANDNVEIYPNNKETKASYAAMFNSLYVRSFDPGTNSVRGYGLATQTRASVRWSLMLPEDSTLVGWSGIDSFYEKVALPAHQQGNDGLLIKYLNPHVIVVAALQQTTLLVYMLDTVTGHIVRQYKHKDAGLPVNVDRSENWAFVTYYNLEGRRTEISSIAMYEGEIEPDELNPWSKTPLTLQDDQNNDIGASFSSFSAPDPVVLQKTFIFPDGIKTMVTTQSKRGITNKHLVMGLVSDQMLLLDRRMLDPRRPTDKPTPDDMKEGLFQYNPIIQYNNGGMVTYTKNVPRLRQIYTVPAELESTSLLVGVGLDMFYARSIPARGFDLMPGDFSYAQLMLICVGLTVATLYAQGAVRRKNLNQQWA
jgi:outer membrane protein assembly factor BamB